MRFFKVFGGFCVCLAALTAVLSSCNIPEPLPSATPTPDHTATPIPTKTPTATPVPTETPIPAWLDVAPDDLEGTTLTLRYSLDGKARDKLKELAEQFSAENGQGITVRAVPAYSADELSSEIYGEDRAKSGLVIADSAWLQAMNRNGDLLARLDDFMQDPEIGLEDEAVTPLMPGALAMENRDDSYYALPLWTEPGFLFYNKTWAIELGFPESPEDLASFAEQACAAGKASYNEEDNARHGTGGWIVSSDPVSVMSWLLTFSREPLSQGDLFKDGSGELFSEAAAWLRNLFDNGCAWNSRVKEPYDYFANRYALFYSGTYSDAERQFNAFERSESHGFDNWDLLVYPHRTAGERNDPRICADTMSIGILFGDPREMNAAWQFIRWLYRDEHAAELALSAGGWPVQDNDRITKLYRNSGEDKLYQSLSLRQYLVDSDTDENRLTDRKILSDGFAYIFNPSAKPDDIPGIWEQIGASIAEINSVDSVSGNTSAPGE